MLKTETLVRADTEYQHNNFDAEKFAGGLLLGMCRQLIFVRLSRADNKATVHFPHSTRLAWRISNRRRIKEIMNNGRVPPYQTHTVRAVISRILHRSQDQAANLPTPKSVFTTGHGRETSRATNRRDSGTQPLLPASSARTSADSSPSSSAGRSPKSSPLATPINFRLHLCNVAHGPVVPRNVPPMPTTQPPALSHATSPIVGNSNSATKNMAAGIPHYPGAPLTSEAEVLNQVPATMLAIRKIMRKTDAMPLDRVIPGGQGFSLKKIGDGYGVLPSDGLQNNPQVGGYMALGKYGQPPVISHNGQPFIQGSEALNSFNLLMAHLQVEAAQLTRVGQ